MMTVRREVHYRGNVQGVGFRYTVLQLAGGPRHNEGLTGTVENLRDSRVRLVVEGEEQVVESFLESIAERMTDYLQEIEVIASEPTGEFVRFEIR